MLRRPLVIFILVVSGLVGGAITFLQSKSFAGMVRNFLSRTVPRELGVSVKFSEFQLQVFPPGVSIRNPELQLEDNNFIGIPRDSVLRASRITLRFRPFQMLSGNVRVEQLSLSDAEIDMQMVQKKSGQSRSSLEWSQIFQVKLQSLVLENSIVRLRWPTDGTNVSVKVDRASVSRSEKSKNYPFLVEANVDRVEVRHRENPVALVKLSTVAEVGPRGVSLSTFSARTGDGAEASNVKLSGDIQGNLLDPSGLKSQLQIEASGESDALMKWIIAKEIPAKRPKPPVRFLGKYSLQGKLNGDLLRISQTAVFDGRCTLENGEMMGWPVGQAEALIKVRSQLGGGADIDLDAAKISHPSGGKISVGKTQFSIRSNGLTEKATVGLELDRAKLSWLTGPYSRSVDNMETDFSGSLQVDILSGKDWSVRATASLQSPGLSVFSQSPKKGRSTVIRAGPHRLLGSFSITEGRFRPEGLQLKFEQSQMELGGEISWIGPETQWNLTSKGTVQLTDIKELGGSKIQGQGNLVSHVHGTSKNLAIDFDTELSNFSYINLFFGEVQGRISLLEGQTVLQLQGVKGRIGETPYSLNGPVNFRGEGSLDVSVLFPDGRIEDFISIFHPLTKDLGWFPQSLRGRMKSKGKVHGALGLDSLIVDLSMDGTDWLYLGERFRSVRFSGGLDRGRYHVEGLQARKRAGALEGGISFDTKGRFAWKLATSNLSLRDLDWMLRLDLPIRGELQISSEGLGTLNTLESSTVISLDRTLIRSRDFPRSSLALTSKQGVWSASGSGLGKQVQLEWRHDPRTQAQNQLSLIANRADFSPLLLLLNPKSIQDSALLGRASGSLEFNYQGNAFDKASGALSIQEFLARKKGSEIKLVEPVFGKMTSGDLKMPEIQLQTERGSVAKLTLGSSQGKWECSMGGEVDLAALEFLTPMVQQASGKAELDLVLQGAVGLPQISGKVDLNDGYVRTSAIESPLENLQGRLTLRSGRLALSGVHADLAQGRITAGGQVDFFTDRFPVLDVSVNLDENRIKFYPFQFIKLRSARLRLKGNSLPYDIVGTISVEQGVSREKLANAGQGVSLQSSLYAPPPAGDMAFDFPKFRLKIDVLADSGLIFQNEFLDVEMKAALTVVNTIEAPRLLGKAELVPGQGKLNFKDHVFQVQSAVIKFDNPAVISPIFDLIATTDISGTKVQLYTSGTADRFKVELSSNPVLPEAEILSLLAMGRTLEESQRLRAGNTSGVQQSEAASLILNSLDFNRDVREKTGFQVGVSEAVDTASGSSIFRPQGDVESSVAPKIVLKRQIGKRIDVSLGSTVGSGTTNQKEVNADFYISPSVSLRGVWNYSEGSTAQESTILQQSRTSYGVDLKLQKRFK
ncbi:MAG: translocation/assembly module TamB domain-containing protein [Bdellovibrionales bacterium]|nr:translocation/assembly module TamB domain-containing protein [Bdellovibrionales bacterium]